MANKITKLMLNWEEYLIREYKPWQPSEYTIWYRPLEEDLNDYSWNNNNFSLKTWTISYWTESGGGKYAYFNWSTWTNYLNLSADFSKPFTISLYLNPRQDYTNNNHVVVDLWSTGYLAMRTMVLNTCFQISEKIIDNHFLSCSTSLQNWHYITMVWDGTNLYLYHNGVLAWTDTIHTSAKYSGTVRFSIAQVWDTNSSNFASDIYLAKLIYEKEKWWTANEVSAYFNQTKSLYWIS